MMRVFCVVCLILILVEFSMSKESYLKKPCGKTKHILFKEKEKSQRMVEIELKNDKIIDCFIYGNKSLAEKWISKKSCKPNVKIVKRRELSDWALKCSNWLLATVKRGKLPNYSDNDFPFKYNNKIDRNFYDGILV